MRLLRTVLLTSIISCSAFGQTYTVSTFAGGGLPVNIPATAASLGTITGVAIDSAGNIFLGVLILTPGGPGAPSSAVNAVANIREPE